MLGNVDLARAAEDKRSPRWIQMLWEYTEWRHVVIEPIDVHGLQRLIEKRPRKTVVLINKGKYRALGRNVTQRGLYLPIPSIRNIYLLRYANRSVRKR